MLIIDVMKHKLKWIEFIMYIFIKKMFSVYRCKNSFIALKYHITKLENMQ